MRRLDVQSIAPAVTLAVIAALAALACEREARRFSSPPESPHVQVRLSTLEPGGARQPRAVAGPYDGNAWAISEGQRLFTQYNCSGCHFHGGGGIGPALMDSLWIYGSDPLNVHNSIAEGRPNGMPSYGGHISDDQIWKLEAYVRTLPSLADRSAETGREDHMEAHRSSQATPRQEPSGAPAEPPSAPPPPGPPPVSPMEPPR